MKWFIIPALVLFCGFTRPASYATVQFWWNPSPSPNVVRYVIRWGEQSGQYQFQDSTSNTTAKLQLRRGKTWFVVCRGVHTSGVHGDLSNELRVKIP